MVRLVDYIKKCLKDEKFREAWEEENSDLNPYLFGTGSLEDVLEEENKQDSNKVDGEK